MIKGLSDLAMAALLGEGENKYISDKEIVITFPVYLDKETIINNYIARHKLDNYIMMDSTKSECEIHLPTSYLELQSRWHKDTKKIINEEDINLEVCVLFILLFGTRKLQHLQINTTIDKNYIKTASFYIQKYLNIFVEPAINGFKIYHVPDLFIYLLKYVPLSESTLMIGYLTEKEKENLNTSLNLYQKKLAL